mmetsp:Transcript_37172/g.103803  ORF Transcript_37172/g.103803 Transcript_37172/m.103803 type:complete len:160 (-) Transcript_37172:174-653(-)
MRRHRRTLHLLQERFEASAGDDVCTDATKLLHSLKVTRDVVTERKFWGWLRAEHSARNAPVCLHNLLYAETLNQRRITALRKFSRKGVTLPTPRSDEIVKTFDDLFAEEPPAAQRPSDAEAASRLLALRDDDAATSSAVARALVDLAAAPPARRQAAER